MSNISLRNITNHFQDVRLISLKSWAQANEFLPRDRGGPYIITQEGYDPADRNVQPDEFVLGRSGKWISLSYFLALPVPERRAEFVFGTAAEVMKMMSELPPTAVILRPEDSATGKPTAGEPESDEMAAAIKAAKPSQSDG